MAKRLEELPVYLKSKQFSVEVTALLERPAFSRNRKLRDQIAEATDSVLANMAEGFEQPTDAAVARYLFIAKGSVSEAVIRLESAQRRGWITSDECRRCAEQGGEIGRMLAGWIKYLSRCDWKDRGRHGTRDQGFGDPG